MPNPTRKDTEILTVSIPKELKKQLVQYTSKEEESNSSVVTRALKSYLQRNELDRLRATFAPRFLELGLESDQDIENHFK
jgi:metal-responsive CopG/Arc/MetJ family transcriptional regulator